ncbi:retrovirus-related pol polyprotein from transposon TNT 1-94 [Tanacetum coccineum]
MSASNNSNNSNQQTLAESGANARPPMLEKGNYIPWESRFRRFLDNQLEEGERMWHSIQHGPYQRPLVTVELLTRIWEEIGIKCFMQECIDESNQIVQRIPRTDSTQSKANVQCYNCNEKGHYAHDCQKPKVRDAKYFREQMLLAMKDEAGSHLSNEENDFMLDKSHI